jgi:hypothetical protein
MTMITRKSIESVSAETPDIETSGPPLRSDRCECCSARLRTVRLSKGQMIANTLCGTLPLMVLTLAGYTADKWLERNGNGFFEEPIWHEPLDSWSL